MPTINVQEDIVINDIMRNRARSGGVVRYSARLEEIARSAIGAVGYAISRLMSRATLGNWDIEPEQRLAIEFADKLRVAARDGKLNCVFCHVANEGKRHRIVASILIAMGLIPGAPDYWFIWKDGGGLIELKRPDRKLPMLEGNQAHFRVWAESLGAKYALHNSLEDALATLREWGVLLQ